MSKDRENTASEARLRMIIDMSSDAVMVLSSAGIILFANPAAGQLFERPAAKMIGTEFGFPVLGKEITEIEVILKSGMLQTAEMRMVDIEWEGEKAVLLTLRDITERKKIEDQQQLAHKILTILNRWEIDANSIRNILAEIKKATAFESVAIRLREGEDFPYYVTDGFSEDFLRTERFLCARTKAGEIKRDESGKPLLECLCGYILRGRSDPEQPFFTRKGSFWSNNTTRFLATTTGADRLATRNRCNREGYQSVALIPLRVGEEIIGLLQFNDHRPDRFTPGMIDFFEQLSTSIGVALAREWSQEHLKEEMNFTEKALNSLTDIFYVFDLDGRFLRWNKALNKVTGFSDTKIAAMTPLDFVGKDEREQFAEAIRKAAQGEIITLEGHLVTRDDRRISYEFSGMQLTDARDRPIGVTGVARDITERTQGEDELRRSEEEFHSLAESMPQIVWITRKDGWNIYFNQQWVDYTGLTLEESHGHGWNIPFHPDDQQRAWSAWENATKNSETYSLECRLRRADGAYRWWLVRGVPLLDETGEIIKWFGTCTDIDDIKSNEAEIISSEEKFRIIFDSTNEGILLTDTEGKRFYFANATICRMLGYDQAEIKKIGVMDIHLEKDLPSVLEQFKKQSRNEIVVAPALPVKRKDDSIFYADIQTSLVEISGSQYFLGVFTDITNRQKLEAQLRHSQKMEAVGTLAGGIAHDFNNILNLIMGYGNMVMETLATDSTEREDMSEVLVAADRAVGLTKRLLVFSRKEVAEVSSVNINALILGLQKMLTRIIREDIEFHLDLADTPLTVLADTGQIEQVLINLASNAKDAMIEGGRLEITTGLEEMNEEYVAAQGYGRPGRYALISVADTGQGMNAETQKKIFEPFFTTKGIGEGTGLGLAISYGIIKQHNGYIKVYSEPGEGTVFKIYLPLCDEATSPEMGKAADAPVKHGNETVLMAEDDASLRKMTMIVLESFGYLVITAVDGEDAIEKFMENRELISIVVLDMIMPKKNGKEVGEAIRKVNPGVKILFMSGYTMNIINGKELAKAGSDFIQKPFTPKDLLIKMREILDR